MKKETIKFLKENYSNELLQICDCLENLVDTIYKDSGSKYNENVKQENARRNAEQIACFADDINCFFNEIKPSLIDENKFVSNSYAEDSSERQDMHSLQEDFTKTEPMWFEIEDRKFEATKWKYVLMHTCNYLYEKNNSLFESFIGDVDVNGKNIAWFAKDESEVKDPLPIGDSGIYVRTHSNTQEKCKLIKRMLVKYDIPFEKYGIVLSADRELKRTKSNRINQTEIRFGSEFAGLHLPANAIISFLKEIKKDFRKYKEFKIAEIYKRIEKKITKPQTEYEKAQYVGNTICKYLKATNIIKLREGYQSQKYVISDIEKLNMLIDNPTIIETGIWEINIMQEEPIVKIKVINKNNRKKCINCGAELENSNISYATYTDKEKTQLEAERYVQIKKCSACERLYITEQTYNTHKFNNRLDRINIEFEK